MNAIKWPIGGALGIFEFDAGADEAVPAALPAVCGARV